MAPIFVSRRSCLQVTRLVTYNTSNKACYQNSKATIMADYIPLADLEVGKAYLLKARNIRIGIWDGVSFHGIRTKFRDQFMDEELHYELNDGNYSGTAHAVRELK